MRNEAFEQINSRAACESWLEERRTFFLKQIGEFPLRTSLNACITGNLQGDGYHVENVLFESRPKHHVAGNLYLPETPGLRYRTLKSWSCQRRVVAKAEHLSKGENPRFVVTNLTEDQADARTLYEDLYCQRGEMENRIKEQQLCLFADRTSCATMRANQLRLWFSSVAYVLLAALRRHGLQGTDHAKARCDTIRVKLLKIGAQVRVTCRKVWLSLSEAYPYRELFGQVWQNLQDLPPRPVPG
nr:transposase [Rubinisphaera italica]